MQICVYGLRLEFSFRHFLTIQMRPHVRILIELRWGLHRILRILSCLIIIRRHLVLEVFGSTIINTAEGGSARVTTIVFGVLIVACC